MPHIFAQLPFPKASLAVLQLFCQISNLTLDLGELEEQAELVNAQLGELLSQVEKKFSDRQSSGEEEDEEPEFGEFAEEPPLSPADSQRIEKLFTEAASNRSKAFELKRELDRLGVFADYEDRFLDLFKKQ